MICRGNALAPLLCLLALSCAQGMDAPTPSAELAAPARGAIATAPAAPAAAPAPVLAERRVLELVGQVTLNGQPAALGQAIGSTDTLETGAASRAVITLGKGSIVELAAQTKLALGSSARKKESVKLLLGQVWSLFDGPTDYEVVTDNAVAGVRGTVFFVAAEPKQTFVCACSHAVHMEAMGSAKPYAQEVVAKDLEHRGFAFARNGKKVAVRSMGTVIDPPSHPNAEAKRLLALMPR